MDASTAALFPSRLIPSPLGDIPEGWEVKPLDKIAKFLNGLALQKYPATAEKYLPVIKISQIRQGSAVSADRASVDIPPEYIIEDGDVIFSWSGSLMQVLWTGGRGALNQHLFKVTSDDYPKWLYYLWVGAHMPWFQGIAASKATTMGHIQRIHLEQAQTVMRISSQLSDRFNDAVATKKYQNKLTKKYQNKLEVKPKESKSLPDPKPPSTPR
jgi:type I restriction enzyme S subunit